MPHPMSDKLFYKLVSYVFLFIGAAHLLRALYGWEAIVGGVEIPVWVSFVAAAIALYFAYRGITGKKLFPNKK